MQAPPFETWKNRSSRQDIAGWQKRSNKPCEGSSRNITSALTAKASRSLRRNSEPNRAHAVWQSISRTPADALSGLLSTVSTISPVVARPASGASHARAGRSSRAGRHLLALSASGPGLTRLSGACISAEEIRLLTNRYGNELANERGTSKQASRGAAAARGRNEQATGTRCR